MSMRQAPSPSSFMAAPVGRYLPGRSFAMWAISPDCIGAFHFGAFDSADHPSLARVFPLPGPPTLAERFDIVHDLGGIESFDQRTFAFFDRFLPATVDYLVERTRRLAVVRPDGLMGAAVAGMYHEWVQPRLDARLFDDRGAALDWLGLSPDSPGRSDLESLCARLGPPPFLRHVRAAIATDMRGATLTSVAGALGVTPRTLQRQLAAARSSFRDELVRARIHAAEEMLLDGDDKIECIASEVGFQSTAAFTTMFQRLEGEAPSAFRARHHHRRGHDEAARSRGERAGHRRDPRARRADEPSVGRRGAAVERG